MIVAEKGDDFVRRAVPSPNPGGASRELAELERTYHGSQALQSARRSHGTNTQENWRGSADCVISTDSAC